MLKKYTGICIILVLFPVLLGILCCQKAEEAPAFDIPLDEGWHIHPAAGLEAGGEILSRPGFETRSWYPASVPTTVLAALIKNEVYTDVFFGKNLEAVPSEQFRRSWWYRREFDLDMKKPLAYAQLGFEGINYRANVWLNGKQVAAADAIFGAFRCFRLDVTDAVQAGKNVLAVEVIPPEPGEFTIGFVDWNPRPPDENMGIWRPVKLHLSGPVSIAHPFVTSKVDLETLADAALTVSAEVTNLSDQAVSGILRCELENVSISRELSLNPHEHTTVKFQPEKFKELNIKNPRLWWPNNLGEQNLYSLKISFLMDEVVSSERSVSFGIREVSDYINQEGHRGYKINGKKVLVRGGGWVDDLFLSEDEKNLVAQINYVRHMNLNAIRLEGFWGSGPALYDLCDEHGILMMTGWSCHWEWEEYAGKAGDEFGCIQTPEEMDLIAKSLRDQVIMWRNHPSVFVWVIGSDKLPRPELERKYIKVFEEYDTSRPYLGAAAALESELSGKTAVKMNGPYDYVPPIYWFEDKVHGGAFGFNTETGPGPQPPPLESVKKMIPEEHLWPIDDFWEYHCARNEFNTLDRYKEALNQRYGAADSVEEFLQKAQLMNYEAMRGMFEAFAAHKHNTTGLIQWMLNAAWPKLYWQLYDYYLMPNGAFYGARKAAQPVHILYHYADDGVYVVNDTFDRLEDLKGEVRIFDISSQEIHSESLDISIDANSSKRVSSVPENPDLSGVYFLSLRLLDSSGTLKSDNFYWLSTTRDEMDYPKSEWFVTPIKKYADFTDLNDLPGATVDVQSSFEPLGPDQKINVMLRNTSDAIAFFVELNLVKQESGESVLPIFWDDNYVSLLPGETREISGVFASSDLRGENPVLRMNGWNLTLKGDGSF